MTRINEVALTAKPLRCEGNCEPETHARWHVRTGAERGHLDTVLCDHCVHELVAKWWVK